MNFDNVLNEKIKLIDKHLDLYLPKEDVFPDIIYKSMRYSIFAGGKRLRPVLLLSAAELFNQNFEKAIPFACALEMIHTYSLIHDDLPAMDNDDYRRGKLTNHKVFGEDMAILTGDALLNASFTLMSKNAVEYNDMNLMKAAYIISKAAGDLGMLGGQVVDVISEGKKIDINTLNYIHKNKTAALISAALSAGAVIGGATEKEVLILDKIGENIGISFQIEDDILDVTSSYEVLGKPILSDEKNEKTTYVTLFGIDKSREKSKELLLSAISMFEDSFGNKSEFLIWLTKKLINREK